MLTKKVVKYIQSLSHKKTRDEEDSFIAEGPKVIAEFLSSGKIECKLICAEKDWLLENKTLLQPINSADIIEADQQGLQRISQLKTPNKVLGVFKKNHGTSSVFSGKKMGIMLDDLQDPGNMGTIIRIADWFGIDQIICSENSVDCYNSKVVQSTMGSLLRVHVLYTNLISFIEKNDGIKIYAAVLEGQSIFEMPKINEGFILIGNESKGIHQKLLGYSTNKITIPRSGHAESLNAAVATGIIVSQIMTIPVINKL